MISILSYYYCPSAYRYSYDYEEVDGAGAAAMISHLKAFISDPSALTSREFEVIYASF
jgi:hypothetical protein